MTRSPTVAPAATASPASSSSDSSTSTRRCLGRRSAALPVHDARELAIAEPLHRRQRRRVAAREQAADLLLEAGGYHPLRAPPQPLGEDAPAQRQPDVDDVPLGGAVAPARLGVA